MDHVEQLPCADLEQHVEWDVPLDDKQLEARSSGACRINAGIRVSRPGAGPATLPSEPLRGSLKLRGDRHASFGQPERLRGSFGL
jgi:hypothetical protein